MLLGLILSECHLYTDVEVVNDYGVLTISNVIDWHQVIEQSQG